MAASGKGSTGSMALVTNFSQGCVVLEVGPNRKKYYIHKALLSQHSEYFRKALQGPWKEAEEGVFTLDDIEPTTMNLFAHWLYTQKLPDADEEWVHLLELEEHNSSPAFQIQGRFIPLLKAYTFSDRFFAPKFRQVVYRGFKILLTCLIPPIAWDVYHFAFEHIPSDRIVLQPLVNDYCEYGGLWARSETKEDVAARLRLPPNFLCRVIKQFWECHRGRVLVPGGERCYEEHVTEKEKAECKKLHMEFNEKHGCAYFV